MTFLRSLFEDRQHLFLIFVGLFFIALTIFIFSPFLMPISLAVAFSFGLAPIADRLNSKSKRAKWMTLGYVLFGIGLFIFIFSQALNRSYSLLFGQDRDSGMEALVGLKERITLSIDQFLPFLKNYTIVFPSLNPFTMKQILTNNLEQGLAFVGASLGALLTSLPEVLLYVFTFFTFLILFVVKRKVIYQSFNNANLVDQPDLDLITLWAQQSSFMMIYVNVVVGAVQALILATAAYFAGLEEWSIIFALVFCASFFPLVGTAPISIFLVLLAYSSLGPGATMILLCAGLLTGVTDNVLRSYMVANEESGINPWVILIGILGAIAVFGFSGIFLGPFILSFLIKILPRLNKTISEHGEKPVVFEVGQ